MLSTPFLLGVQFVLLPLQGIVFDVAINVIVVALVANHVIVISPLPHLNIAYGFVNLFGCVHFDVTDDFRQLGTTLRCGL